LNKPIELAKAEGDDAKEGKLPWLVYLQGGPGFAVVHRDIEEQLGNPKFTWIGSNYQYRDQWTNY
jgi:hypothetical protein